jgi:hypothetical protein
VKCYDLLSTWLRGVPPVPAVIGSVIGVIDRTAMMLREQARLTAALPGLFDAITAAIARLEMLAKKSANASSD